MMFFWMTFAAILGALFVAVALVGLAIRGVRRLFRW